MRWATEESYFDSRQGQRSFFYHGVQTCSEVHPAFYPVATDGSFSSGKAIVCGADLSSPCSVEIKDA
jgi:hypothetical protein